MRVRIITRAPASLYEHLADTNATSGALFKRPFLERRKRLASFKFHVAVLRTVFGLKPSSRPLPYRASNRELCRSVTEEGQATARS